MPNRFVFLLARFGAQTLTAAAPTYYPTHRWRESTPEEQGLDSKARAAKVDNITQKHLNVHSVTVIRHGYVVLDSYFCARPDTLVALDRRYSPLHPMLPR